MKKQNWIWIVALLVIGLFVFKGGDFGLFAAGSGKGVTRTFSKIVVEPGEEFTLTFTPDSGVSAWAVEQPMPDGWGGSDINYYSTENEKKTYTLTAPSKGDYVFNAYYWIAEEGEKVYLGGAIVQVIERNTEADTDYDGCVSFSEFTTFANKWVEGKKTFDQFIEVANAWVSQEGCQ